MRKLATGLLSMPAQNVPGSENVEVSEFKEEDAESANKSGFNTMEVDGFENLDHSGEAVLASNKFFNYKIGYEMKKELIKLNHALSGIGYKNLIKVAQEDEKISDYEDLKRQVGIHIRTILNEDYVTGPGGDLSGLPSKSVEYLVNTATEELLKKPFNAENFAIKIINEADNKGIYGLYRNVDKIIENLKYISILQERYIEKQNAMRVPETIDGVPKSIAHPGDDGYQLAERMTSSRAAQTSPVVRPATTLIVAGYIGKTYKDQRNGYQYRIISNNEVFVSKDNEIEKKLTPGNYRNWNNFARILNNQISNGEVEEIKEATPAVNTPVAPAAVTPTPAAAPVTPAPASTGGLVSETVNGRPAVSIGTFGKDQIFLTIDSVNSGNPQFYIKDGASENVAPIGRGDGRVRAALGPLEVARLADRLVGAGVSSARAEAFKTFMNKSRRQKRLPFRRESRGGEIDQASKNMGKTSARQNRLDKLEKKGVI